MPLAGATAPVTLRESIVQHAAETLSGIVLHQLAAPGAPISWGGAPAAFDMRHGTTPMGSMETMLLNLGNAEVGKHLGLPVHGYLALSDAKTADYQAGMETGMGAVLAALAGINLVAGPGILDYILTQSPEKLLLDHEACGMALRLVRGIGAEPADLPTLFADLVKTGEFLSHPHTRAHWKTELTIPSAVIDRDTWADWEAKGRKDAATRAREEVARRLAKEAGSPAPDGLAAELDRIMLAELARYGVTTLPAAGRA
jgi:trimethylamine--corrinoid protein Co-methyltransferase